LLINNKIISKHTFEKNPPGSENGSVLFSWIAGYLLIFIFESSFFRFFYLVEIYSDSTQNKAYLPDVPKSQHPPFSFPKRRFQENACVCGSWLPQFMKNRPLRPQLDDFVLIQIDLKTRTSLYLRYTRYWKGIQYLNF
jgi:hypothetical protein